MSELAERLHFSITVNGTETLSTAAWERVSGIGRIRLKTLISKADKALYDVKRHGKGTYSLFLNGE